MTALDRTAGPKLSPSDRRQLCRELATGEQSGAALGRRYGVTKQAISQFAQKHKSEIDAMRERLDDDFAGLWIASKAARITAYQDDYERSLNNEKYAGHHEHIRTRTQIAQAVAEELGQLPPRTMVQVTNVEYHVEGVDLDALR